MNAAVVRFRTFAVGTVLTTAILGGCNSDAVNPDGAALDSIAVTPQSSVVLVGTSVALTAVLLDASGDTLPTGKITWASEDVSIAEVSQNGIVTGVNPGTVLISASSWGKDAVVSVSVSPLSVLLPAVRRIVITPSNPRIREGRTVQLTATALDANDRVIVGLTVSWSSSDTRRATVDQAGLVRGISDGNVTITAAAGGKSASTTVRIDEEDDD